MKEEPALSKPSSPLLQIVDAALLSATERAGPHLACRPGCAQCCHGVFEISALDAARLRDGLAAAPLGLATRIHARLAAARAHLEAFYPGDPETGVLGDDDEAIELFEEWAHADACPILDPVTQTCDLYAARPILCRTFGPPMRNDVDDPEAGIAICELCFTEATVEEIAAAEMSSDFREQQYTEEEAYLTDHPGQGNTMIAFAFPASHSDPLPDPL